MPESPYANCRLCPRACGVNRENGEIGYCGEISSLRLAFAGLHFGEEPPVTGSGGSGTIFVSGCNLGCAFCQNLQISGGNRISNGYSVSPNADISSAGKSTPLGREVDNDEFAGICLELQNRGAENINIVTGSHAAPALASGIMAAKKMGLSVPVLWNSSGYDGILSLEIFKDVVDVYLPDLKTLDPKIAFNFFNAPDYPDCAKAAIQKMMDFRKLRYDITGKTLSSGVMIRHLVLPGFPQNTRQVLRWFSENCRSVMCNGSSGEGNANYVNCNTRALLSLMTQYTHVNKPLKTPVQKQEFKPEIPDRYVSPEEYDSVLSMLDEYGIEDGFCQELVTGSDWLPDFNRPNPFSSELSVPVWHWNQ